MNSFKFKNVFFYFSLRVITSEDKTISNNESKQCTHIPHKPSQGICPSLCVYFHQKTNEGLNREMPFEDNHCSLPVTSTMSYTVM